MTNYEMKIHQICNASKLFNTTLQFMPNWALDAYLEEHASDLKLRSTGCNRIREKCTAIIELVEAGAPAPTRPEGF